jgi:predicted nucleic acid-binding protein
LPRLQLFDSSVLIPWLRNRPHDSLVTAAFESRQFLLCAVVWMELYAGTRSRGDKQDLDRMQQAMSSIGRVVAPAPEDFYTAGQMMSQYIRRYGHIEVRDHANDVLIALCAWRGVAELVTVNQEDMKCWQSILRRSGKRLTLRVIEG